MLAIKIDEVDRELHPERVYRFARDNPQSLACGKSAAAQETFGSFGAAAGDLNVGGEACPPRDVGYLEAHILINGVAEAEKFTDA